MKYENIVKIYLPIDKKREKRTQKKRLKKNTFTTYFCFFTGPVMVPKKEVKYWPTKNNTGEACVAKKELKA